MTRISMLALGLLLAGTAVAQPVTLPVDVTLGGYVEAYGAWNFAQPANGITAFRAFDSRHDSLTVQNAVLSAAWQEGAWSGRLALQFGLVGPTYFAGEPVRQAGGGIPASGPEVWRHVQEAFFGWQAPIGAGLQIDGGLFLSPVGPEVVPVKDNLNWSRSNLFFGLPFYHTGVRATYPLSPTWSTQVALINGWNSVVDGNTGKTVHAMLSYKRQDGALAANLLYMGGVERPTGAAEGQPWRHLFDLNGSWDASPALTLALHGDTGWEDNAFGRSAWLAGAICVRQRLWSWAWLAVRADAFRETVAPGASAIFWPVRWVSSGTATFDMRPVGHTSVRLELRHDQAAGSMYFRGAVSGEGSVASPFVANSDSQDSATLGLVTWF